MPTTEPCETATLSRVLLRKLLILGAVSAVAAAPSAAAATALMPGVTYTRLVRWTPAGRVVMHVLIAPRPGGLYGLRPVLAGGTILGRETVTSMQRRASTTGTVAGVNGDFFAWADGHPSGIFMKDGILMSPPLAGRSSIGISADGTLRVNRIAFFGTWQALGQAHALNGLNEPPPPNGVSVFTRTWGAATPRARDTTERVLYPFPDALPNTDLASAVTSVTLGGNTPIPPGGAVLVSRGSQSDLLAAEAPVGETITTRLILRPAWSDVVDALGGGPVLVRDGREVAHPYEDLTADQLFGRSPRTAVGQLADGRVILIAVDGRQPGYSIGVTNDELARTLLRFGAVTGSAVDSGGSTTMAFNGRLLNRPSDPGGERRVGESLLVFYYGVYAPPVAVPVLSPNGDGIADRQVLRYKLVEPAAVDAKLVDPAGVPHFEQTDARPPGTYRLVWNGLAEGGSPGLEGRWRWVVTATDDAGRESSVERVFSLNRTLGALRLRPTPFALRRARPLRVTFSLAHAARVRVTVETRSGEVVRTLVRGPRAAGSVSLSWPSRGARRSLRSFRDYVLRVSASNALGRVDLTRQLRVSAR